MNSFTYSYRFSDINDSSRYFAVDNYRDSESYQACIAVDDREFLKTGRTIPANAADIVDFAVAVAAADRLSISKDDTRNSIHVVLPVRNPEAFSNSRTSKLISDILYWYTGDYWYFSFTKHSGLRRSSESQECLPFDLAHTPREVALWSGGLDALAGLYNRLNQFPETHFTLLGTGSSNIVHNNQKETIVAVERVATFLGRTKLIRIPIKITQTIEHQKNRQLRARGFVFLLIGTVCAYIEGQDLLNVYENGVGAINLPYRASEVGLDHARSVHPISLLDMSTLASELLGVRFSLQNPFLFSTKAQMCEQLVNNGMIEMIHKSISCDRLRHEHPMQCGLCSSCLLRRQSLAVLGVEDPDNYVATAHRDYGQDSQSFDTSHLRAMVSQVETLRKILSMDNPWDKLSRRYTTLMDTVDRTAQHQGLSTFAMQQKLLEMYGRYVTEWDLVGPAITSTLAVH